MRHCRTSPGYALAEIRQSGPDRDELHGSSTTVPAALILALAGLGALVAWQPLLWTTLAVGFLAGPHNLMEARYLLGRLPRRAGKLRFFMGLSALGVLSIGCLSLYLAYTDNPYSLRIWATLLLLWVGSLLLLRSREHPRRNWPWVEPVVFLLCGWIWLSPVSFALSLVLFHPLMAILVLGRELHFYRRPERAYYRPFLGAVAGGLVVLLLTLGLHPSPAPSAFNNLVVIHGPTLPFLAVHTYLEIVHYAIWILLLPALAASTRRGRLEVYPVLRNAPRRLWAARAFLGAGLLVSALLWWGFAVDFEFTRDLYFQVAIFHVLVEFPFLIRTI